MKSAVGTLVFYLDFDGFFQHAPSRVARLDEPLGEIVWGGTKTNGVFGSRSEKPEIVQLPVFGFRQKSFL